MCAHTNYSSSLFFLHYYPLFRRHTGWSNTLGHCSRQCHICCASVTDGIYNLPLHIPRVNGQIWDWQLFHYTTFQLSSTVADWYVAYHALYDFWCNMLRSISGTRHQFDPEFGFQQKTVSWKGNINSWTHVRRLSDSPFHPIFSF
jgi:hypothetical protein